MSVPLVGFFFITPIRSFSLARNMAPEQRLLLPRIISNSLYRRRRHYSRSSGRPASLFAIHPMKTSEIESDDTHCIFNIQEDNPLNPIVHQQPRYSKNIIVSFIDKRLVSCMLLVVLIGLGSIGGFPQAAHAGFGPSSGATTSPPPGLAVPKVQNQDLISGTAANKKLKVLIGSSLDERRLAEFNQQLDIIIDSLRDQQQRDGSVDPNIYPDIDTEADINKKLLLDKISEERDEESLQKVEELEKEKEAARLAAEEKARIESEKRAKQKEDSSLLP